MHNILNHLPHPHRNGVQLIFIISLLTLAIVFGFEYIGGYPPCELCWYQRYPYMLTMALSALILLLEVNEGYAPSPTSRALSAICCLAFITGAGIAAFHVGVEQQWWQGLDSCSAPIVKSDDLNAVLDSIMAAPIVKCDEIAWSLFGISMAGYNFLLSLGLIFLSGLATIARK